MSLLVESQSRVTRFTILLPLLLHSHTHTHTHYYTTMRNTLVVLLLALSTLIAAQDGATVRTHSISMPYIGMVEMSSSCITKRAANVACRRR